MNRRIASTALVAAFLLAASPAIAKHSVGDTPERRANFAKYAILEKQGDDLLVQGQFAEAEAYLRRALDFCPAETMTLMHLGLALDRQGQTDEAFDFYQKAFSPESAASISSNYPEDIEAYTRYGIMNEARGRHAEAVRCFNQARRWAKAGPLPETLDAQTDSPLKVRTMLNIVRGIAIESATRDEGVTRTAESLAAYQEAATKMPSDAHAQFFLGDRLREAGRFDEAKAVLQRAAKMDADGSLKADTENSLKQAEARQR